MSSDSRVVNPTPENADRAWNRAASVDSPVVRRATVATRVIISPSVTTIRSEATPITAPPPVPSCRRLVLLVEGRVLVVDDELAVPGVDADHCPVEDVAAQQ